MFTVLFCCGFQADCLRSTDISTLSRNRGRFAARLYGRAGSGRRGGSRRHAGRGPRSAPQSRSPTPTPFLMPLDGNVEKSTTQKSSAINLGTLWRLAFQRGDRTSAPAETNSSEAKSTADTPKVVDLLKFGAWVGIFSLVALEFCIHVLYKKDWLAIFSKTT